SFFTDIPNSFSFSSRNGRINFQSFAVKSASLPPFNCSLETFLYGSRMNIAPPEASENKLLPGYGYSCSMNRPSKNGFNPLTTTKPPPLYGSPAMNDSAR